MHKNDENKDIKLEETTIEEVLENKFQDFGLEESKALHLSKEEDLDIKGDNSFKVPKSPKIPMLM